MSITNRDPRENENYGELTLVIYLLRTENPGINFLLGCLYLTAAQNSSGREIQRSIVGGKAMSHRGVFSFAFQTRVALSRLRLSPLLAPGLMKKLRLPTAVRSRERSCSEAPFRAPGR